MLLKSSASAVLLGFGEVETLADVGSTKVFGFEAMVQMEKQKEAVRKLERKKYHGNGIRRSTRT